MMKKLFIILLLFSLQACSPLNLRTEFNPVGRMDAFQNKPKAVNSYQDILVYLKSAPEGFTLKENELKIEEGFDHIILGEIKVFIKRPYDAITEIINAKYKTIEELKQAAFEKGANAIIYCVTNISNDPSEAEFKRAVALGFGSGWAVIVQEKFLR
jgi:hypothetical protein